jgi:hypothetical protein
MRDQAIYPSTLQMMCTVLISVFVCSSIADGWPGSNCRFLTNPYVTVPNASIVTGTIFVLPFHILLTSFSKSLYLFSFSVSFVLTFESSSMARSISRQAFSPFSCSMISGQFASLVWSMTTGKFHIIVVPLTFRTLWGSYYLSVTCNPICLHIIQWM